MVEFLFVRDDYIEERHSLENGTEAREHAEKMAITSGTSDVIDVYVKLGSATPKAEWEYI